MRTKYRNDRTRGFASKKEARRYDELRILELGNLISDLKTQVSFVLIPEQKDAEGQLLERALSYVADFTYFDMEDPDWPHGRFVVEDAKGVRTREYIIKRKLMLWIHHIRIREV